MPLLALLLAASVHASPARLPALDVESVSRDLTSLDNRLYQAIDSLLSTPVEAPRVPALKTGADGVAAAGASLLGSARDVPALLARPADAAQDYASGSASVDARYGELAGAPSRLAKRLDDGRSRLRRLRERDRRAPDEPLNEAERQLAAAETALSGAREPLAAADAERSGIRDAARHCRDRRAEIERAQGDMERPGAQLPSAAQALKARLDVMGDPPDPEKKTRVFRAMDDLLDPARQLHGMAAPLVNRLSQFKSAYAAFAKGAARFNESLETAGARQEEAAARLYSAERLLSDAERY